MFHFNESPLEQLWGHLSSRHLGELLRRALEEDGASEDITSRALCGADRGCQARVVTRHAGVVAGLGLIEACVNSRSVKCTFAQGIQDGVVAPANATLAHLDGKLIDLLPIERVMLNLLGLTMATATLTRHFVDAVAPAKARICDTRKTIAGLRWLQKYAVRCGGGCSHRWGLNDAFLAKDNHVAGLDPKGFARSIRDGVERVRTRGPEIAFVCAEVDSMEQFEALLSLETGVLDIVLLDNFSHDELVRAVRLRDRHHPSLQLEASGGVKLETVSAIASTGVDRISVGAITHSAGWHDVALDIDA